MSSSKMKALTCAAALSIISGCGTIIDFNSASPLGDGVRGKRWYPAYFIDAPLYTPVSYATANRVSTFDAAVSGNQVQLVATWQDANQLFHKGYARLYTDSSGWSPIGPNFSAIATDGSVELGSASVAAGPGGLFVANFFAASVANNSVSASYTGTSWQTYTANTTTTAIPEWTLTDNMINGPRTVSTVDSVGRGYVFFADDTAGTGSVYRGDWQAANAGGLDPSLTDLTGAAVSADSGVTARFDGSTQVCGTYELDATKALTATCQNVATDFSTTTDTISSDTMAGHETATDGAGNIMAVFYQISGADYHVYASLGAAGVWPATPTQIDGAMTSGYLAPSPALIAGARPGVAYLGSGNYIAVWVGVSAGTTPKSTALFSSVYTAGVGWSAAAPIADTYDPYSAIPHPQGLHVFSNGNGNAGFALNTIYTTQEIAPAAATTPDIYAESNQVRRVVVARWQTNNGWLPVNGAGNLCYNYSGTPGYPENIGQGDEAECSHRPTGVILPSGNTLVFFQDRDTNSSSSHVGNQRLAVLEFKP